ncbi:MAG: hypothetical protein ACPGLY_08680 [Rubripirellula sp.]
MAYLRQLAEITVREPGRLVIYGVISFVFGQMLYELLASQGVGFIGQENGPVEWSQAIFASFAAFAFFIAAKRSDYGKAGLVLCGALSGYAAARECDQVLETIFFSDAHKYLIGLPLLVIAVATAWKYRQTVLTDSLRLARTPAIVMFGVAGVYLCAVCQVFDRPGFWVGIDDHPNALATKMLVEEFAEVFGYLLVAFSGLEAVIEAFGRRAKESIALPLNDANPTEASARRAA